MASKGLPTTFTTLAADILYGCVVDGVIYGGTGTRGVEAFNRIVSLRHNKHNGNGGGKRTHDGAPTELCPEFWSLGQWLGRWSMWQLGYGDDMDPDRSQHYEYIEGDAACEPCEIETDSDTDDTYTPSPGRTEGSQNSRTNTSSDDDCLGTLSTSDDTALWLA